MGLGPSVCSMTLTCRQKPEEEAIKGASSHRGDSARAIHKGPSFSGTMAPRLPRLLGCLIVASVVLPGSHAFFPNFWSKFLSVTWGSYTHQDLTEEAILNVTLQILLDNKHPTRPPLNKQDFQGKTLIADDILRAYFGEEVSVRQFRASVRQIVNANANTDFLNGTRDDPLCHFDSERLQQGNSLLLRAREDLLTAMKAKDYEGSRQRLGQMLHSLQDFYSHTNWVEMGNTDIYPDLASPGKDITSLAGASDQTCIDCTEVSCRNNIAESVQKRNLLTSGYFGETPKKPRGKCSHGGPFDYSSRFSARGGINKDTNNAIYSPHHFLHTQAAELALRATIQFLSQLRKDVTDREMLRLLGVSSFPALSFVLDTTGSMGEEITAVRRQANEIINRQNLLYPDYYILVPFHDPGFGPVFKTSDPNEFRKYLNSLVALGGGDEPEMCLSALRLALIHTPPHSEIFVFTDASAKDIELRSSVEALIQDKKMKVSFLITEDPSLTRGRSRRELLRQDRFDLYSELAMTSGGQVIFTNNEDISSVSDVIGESAHFDMVKLLHLQSERKGNATHVFEVDKFLHSVSLYINGEVKKFNIIDPAGHVQHGVRRSSGTLTRISLKDPLSVGSWSIVMTTMGLHTLHVQGRSSVDFLYYFGASMNGSHPGLYTYTNQPVAGVPAVLVVETIGLPETAHLDHVSLTSIEGETQSLELRKTSKAGLLVTEVGHMPIGEFRVGVSGQDDNEHALHREAPQHLKAAECVVEMSNESPSALTPGSNRRVSLTISNYAPSTCYSVSLISDDSDFTINQTIGRLNMNRYESHVTEFWIKAPNTAKEEAVVTVIASIASCEKKTRACFTMLTLVVQKKTRVSPKTFPSCTLMSYSGSCPPLSPGSCQSRAWGAVLQVSDRDGVKSVQILFGTGSISHGPDGPSERIEFTSDCCSPSAEILLTTYRRTTGYCHLTAPSAATQLGQNKTLVLLLGLMIYYITSWTV
ncbi:von Willebrand factor A domain-containing protein 7 [Spea bombifrons]|uniref:von Willebrand factor A domain-containing protein 7 n=1 Tax=Spea bombifrons TaxID=233779 RepID=UPI00234913BA|nr:von Willebrand factor A domain-containing protein 7 [Spea bombifrons]